MSKEITLNINGSDLLLLQREGKVVLFSDDDTRIVIYNKPICEEE